MAHFENIPLGVADWDKTLVQFEDRNVFQSNGWLKFVAEDQKADPVLAALKEDGRTLGYFCGLIVKKMGLRILGSPFPGWSTPYMGFNLHPGVPRRTAVMALADLAFKQLRCAYVEVVDSEMTTQDIEGLGFTHRMNPSLEIDLTQDEETIFNGMDSTCRRNIRKAEKSGVTVEVATDIGFAEEYAEQLKDVFAKQGLVPHYGADRVRLMIKHLLPTGMLLIQRARDAEGRCIGTGIYPASNRCAYYVGGASWRQYQILRPNELLHWRAMQHWRQRGIKAYNFVGNMNFKQKFGGKEISTPMIGKARNPMISLLRATAPHAKKNLMRLTWAIKSMTGRTPKPE